MTKLLYRGKKYIKSNNSASIKVVKLTYRRNIYIKKKNQLSKESRDLTYRGNKYLSNKSNDHDQNLIFSLARKIIRAQFILGNDQLTDQLWNEVGARNIDPRRVINLMYNCSYPEDEKSMIEIDCAFQQQS